VRRVLTALAVLAVIALAAAPAQAGKGHHHKHRPAGIQGVVLNSGCPGVCTEPPPAPALYTGSVTIDVRRAADGAPVASQATSDGHFRMRVKRGAYDVSATPPSLPPCEPTPETVCPLQAQGAAIIAPCVTGETQRVKVHRHRFTRVELQMRNHCIV
jgi:hypothetical protein